MVGSVLRALRALRASPEIRSAPSRKRRATPRNLLPSTLSVARSSPICPPREPGIARLRQSQRLPPPDAATRRPTPRFVCGWRFREAALPGAAAAVPSGPGAVGPYTNQVARRTKLRAVGLLRGVSFRLQGLMCVSGGGEAPRGTPPLSATSPGRSPLSPLPLPLGCAGKLSWPENSYSAVRNSRPGREPRAFSFGFPTLPRCPAALRSQGRKDSEAEGRLTARGTGIAAQGPTPRRPSSYSRTVRGTQSLRRSAAQPVRGDPVNGPSPASEAQAVSGAGGAVPSTSLPLPLSVSISGLMIITVTIGVIIIKGAPSLPPFRSLLVSTWAVGPHTHGMACRKRRG